MMIHRSPLSLFWTKSPVVIHSFERGTWSCETHQASSSRPRLIILTFSASLKSEEIHIFLSFRKRNSDIVQRIDWFLYHSAASPQSSRAHVWGNPDSYWRGKETGNPWPFQYAVHTGCDPGNTSLPVSPPDDWSTACQAWHHRRWLPYRETFAGEIVLELFIAIGIPHGGNLSD